MVHYHQQALQFIMLVDIFEVFCITVAITNPVCKNTYDTIHRKQLAISQAKAFKSSFFCLFFVPPIRTGIVMEST